MLYYFRRKGMYYFLICKLLRILILICNSPARNKQNGSRKNNAAEFAVHNIDIAELLPTMNGVLSNGNKKEWKAPE